LIPLLLKADDAIKNKANMTPCSFNPVANALKREFAPFPSLKSSYVKQATLKSFKENTLRDILYQSMAKYIFFLDGSEGCLFKSQI
jgi:hypothetical protein